MNMIKKKWTSKLENYRTLINCCRIVMRNGGNVCKSNLSGVGEA